MAVREILLLGNPLLYEPSAECLPGETGGRGLDAMPEKPDYLSLILVPPARKRSDLHADPS